MGKAQVRKKKQSHKNKFKKPVDDASSILQNPTSQNYVYMGQAGGVSWILWLIVILALSTVMFFASKPRPETPVVNTPVNSHIDFSVSELSHDLEDLTSEIERRYESMKGKVLTLHERTAKKMAGVSADRVADILNTELGIWRNR